MSERREGEGAFDWLGGGGRRATEVEESAEVGETRETERRRDSGGAAAPVPDRPPRDRRPRRKAGKRNNPDYHQASAYVRKDVYRRVQQALLSEEQSPDYSTLVESLLIQWLEEVGWEFEEPRS